MNKFWGFTKRNLLLFFKNKATIFFSMLSPIIIFVLYILFLRGTFVVALDDAAEMAQGLITKENIDAIANGLLLSGLLGSALFTVPYCTLTTIINDRENKIDYDISATPMSRVQIILSYFTASAISALIMTTIVMAVGLIILCANFEMHIGATDVFKLLGINLLGSVCSTAMFMLIVMFFKKMTTSNAFFGLLSSVSGFIIGAYIPLHEFSETVQTICNIFPQTGITCLMRNTILSGVLTDINDKLRGMDQGVFEQSVREVFSFNMRFCARDFSVAQTVVYVTIITLVVIAALGVIYPKVYKRK